MSKQGKSRKPLVIGIVAAVVILAALLGLILANCSGMQKATPTTTAASETVPTTQAPAAEVESYALYWNLDRALYDGKSEAGMSSRMPEADGFFHVRFFCDGEELILRVLDRRVINRIDTENLMGLAFDDDGIVVDVIPIEELPLEQVGWQFYIQSVGGTLIKLNSSSTMAGMEVLLEATANTQIYDMSGKSGPVGCEATPVTYDRVMAIQNLAGELTHLFLYERPYYMLTYDAYCEHCKETVTWNEWTMEETLPTVSGHYQLQNDLPLKGQHSMASDVKICLDLNGHTIEGKQNSRLISIHNPGGSLAIMDTSEGQTGKLVGHSTSSPQGGLVWVRYGQFHFYGGTLDASDMISRLNGTAVQVPKNAFFYMYGGTIIGGTAAPQYNESTGKYTYGLGGSVQVAGTMRMYGGVIRDGKAPAAYYYNKGKLVLARGMGGNIFLSSGSVLEMNGGQILYGYAGNVGGNIMMDGTAQLILNDGSISGAWIDPKLSGKSGANIYCASKGVIEMNGGCIDGGIAKNSSGGNIYLAGTMVMTNGSVLYGKAAVAGGNIYMGGAAKLTIYGGAIGHGVANGQVAGNGGGNIHLGGTSSQLKFYNGTIFGGTANGLVNEDGSTLGGDGGNINANRGTVELRGGWIYEGQASGNGDGIYVGWNSKALILRGKACVYNNGEKDIVRSGNTKAGVSQILLNAWEGNGEYAAPVVDRVGGVAGSLIASPYDKTTLTAEDVLKLRSGRLALPLAMNDKGQIILSKVADLGAGDHHHCICGGNLEHTCQDTGFVSVNAAEFKECWSASDGKYFLLGSLNLCLTEDVVLDTEYALSGATLNLCLHGHTVHMQDQARISINGTTGVLNITDCTEKGKILAAEGSKSSFLYTYKGKLNIYAGTVDGSKLGAGLGAVRVGYEGDVFTLYGGTVIGSKNATTGGSVYCSVAGTINIKGGTIRDGVASAGGGGNIFLTHDKAVLNISGGTVTGGKATNTKLGSGLGGNIHVVRGKVNITGGTITGGTAAGTAAEGEPVGISGGVYAAYNAGTFTLTDDAKIYGNTGSDIWLTSKASYIVTLGTWAGNGEYGPLVIGKTGGTVGSQLVGSAERADLALFASAHEGLVLKLSGNKIVLATPFVHDHCLCVGELTHTCQQVSFLEVANKSDFDALFNANRELSGSVSIALTGDFTLDAEYKTAGHTLDICLNGHTVTMSGKGRITANGGGTLNLTDCADGAIVAAKGAAHAFLYTYVGDLNLYAGTVDASAIELGLSSGKYGGAVYVAKSGDTFTMYGGIILGGQLERGGAVYVQDGSIVLRGGLITGGETKVGGGVGVNFGSFEMTGGAITGNSASDNGAGVFLGYNMTTKGVLGDDAMIYGNTGPNDIYAGHKSAANRPIILDGWKGNGENGPAVLYINGAVAGTVMATAKEGKLTENDLKLLASGHEDMKLVLDEEGRIVLAEIIYHDHCICGGTLKGTDGHTCSDLRFTEIANTEAFKALFDADRKLLADCTVVLMGDIELDNEYAMTGHTMNLCLNGHTITLSDGGRLTANTTTGTLNITDCAGGKILAAEGCRTSILYTYKGTINIYGGTVDASLCAEGAGGAIRVAYAGDLLNIYGGTVIGSRKGTTGGTIYVTAAGTVNISGGTVRDGVATAGGGNIAMVAGTLNISGGTVEGGSAKTSGNIQMNGDAVAVNISGGTVRGGVATSTEVSYGLGGNIHVIKGILNVTGGTITGGTSKGKTTDTDAAGITGGVYVAYNGILNLSGNARIYGNEGCDIYLSSRTNKDIFLLGAWEGNGSNGSLKLGKLNAVAGTKVVAAAADYTLTETDLAKFTYRAEDMKLALKDGGFVLEEILYHEHCLCNGQYTGHSCTDVRFEEIAGTEEFLALFDADRKLKESVSVYLTGDVELSAEYWTNGLTLSICLNGHTIDLKTGGRLTSNTNTGVLNITDCGDGTVKGTTQSFLYGYNGDINLYGGTVDASAISLGLSGGKYGGAVYMANAGDTFTMYGGTVLGGQLERGGAVFAQKGGVVIRGGLITGGKAKVGGGVAVNYGTFEMTGGEITGNNATTNGAGVFLGYNMTTKGILGGSAAICGNTGCEDVRLGQKAAENNRFVLDGWTGCGEGRVMTLSSASGKDGAVVAEAKTGTVSESLLASLASYDADYVLQLNGDGRVAMKARHKHCVCGGSLEKDETHTCSKVYWTEVDGEGFLALFGTDKKLTASHTVVLTGDVTLDAEYTLNGHTLELCLNGHTITMSGNGRITSNGTTGVLNLTDCAGGKLLAAEKCQIGILYTYKGVLNIYGGTVDASLCAAGDYGAIRVGYAGDALNIYGGTVIGSKNAAAGGSIYMTADGTVTMYGGTVKDGKTTGGGGNLHVAAGKTYIKGGTVSGGIGACGGNIHVYKTAQLFVEGGTISGGVSNGTKSGYGGGNIYLGDGSDTTGSVTISGGTITGGTSGLEGGNINVNRGSMVITGGTITGGSSSTAGGGIYVGWNGTGVTVSGNALIYGNAVTDIVRCANTSTTKGILLLGDWAGNGEHGAAKLDSLFTATGKTVIAPAGGYTLTEADLAKFECVGTYGLALSGGKFVTAAK